MVGQAGVSAGPADNAPGLTTAWPSVDKNHSERRGKQARACSPWVQKDVHTPDRGSAELAQVTGSWWQPLTTQIHARRV